MLEGHAEGLTRREEEREVVLPTTATPTTTTTTSSSYSSGGGACSHLPTATTGSGRRPGGETYRQDATGAGVEGGRELIHGVDGHRGDQVGARTTCV